MSYEKKTFNEIVNKSKYLSVRNQKNWWLDSNIQKIFREACDHFLEYNLNEELTSNKKSGIVICGGGKYLLSTYCVVKGIRHFGCSLPITLFCYNEEEITEKDKKLFFLKNNLFMMIAFYLSDTITYLYLAYLKVYKYFYVSL